MMTSFLSWTDGKSALVFGLHAGIVSIVALRQCKSDPCKDRLIEQRFAFDGEALEVNFPLGAFDKASLAPFSPIRAPSNLIDLIGQRLSGQQYSQKDAGEVCSKIVFSGHYQVLLRQLEALSAESSPACKGGSS